MASLTPTIKESIQSRLEGRGYCRSCSRWSRPSSAFAARTGADPSGSSIGIPVSTDLPKTRPVTGSEWMIAIRDYKFDLTVYEISVGALYGTCGNWGQRVYLSDVAISDITGMTRRKAGAVRKTLLALGLIEDIGQHGTQPSQREYRLTLPAVMPAMRRGDAPVERTPCAPGAHPGESVEHIGVRSQGTQQLDPHLDPHPEEQQQGDADASPSGQTQTQDSGLGDTPSVDSPRAERSPAELRDAVLNEVLARATKSRPIGPRDVAGRLDASTNTVHDIMIDLAGGGFTKYPDGSPLDAMSGRYWPRAA